MARALATARVLVALDQMEPTTRALFLAPTRRTAHVLSLGPIEEPTSKPTEATTQELTPSRLQASGCRAGRIIHSVTTQKPRSPILTVVLC